MSAVTITWLQRAAGRWPGDEETIELTEYVQALIDQGRVEVEED